MVIFFFLVAFLTFDFSSTFLSVADNMVVPLHPDPQLHVSEITGCLGTYTCSKSIQVKLWGQTNELLSDE